MQGHTFFHRWGFSINEGGTPFNLHVRWGRGIGFYVYLFGRCWYWFHH